MSNKFSIEQLENKIALLEAENSQLRQQQSQVDSALIQRWHKLVNQSEGNFGLLTQVMTEVCTKIHAQAANLCIYDPLRNVSDLAVSYPTVDEESRKESTSDHKDFPMIADVLQSGKSFVINSRDELPVESADRASLMELKQQSLILVPIMLEGKLVGFIDIHTLETAKHWSEEEIALVEMMAPVIYQGYQKRVSLRYEIWLEKIGRQLTASTELETLESCFRDICNLIDLDGVTLYVPVIPRNLQSHSGNYQTIEIACSYPPVYQLSTVKQYIELVNLPWLYSQLIKGDKIVIDDIERLEELSEKERVALRKFQQPSMMLIPLLHGGQLAALLSLHTIDRHRNWSQRDVRQAQLVLPLFYTAYQQLHLRSARQESLNTLQSVLDTTNVGYCIINRDSSFHYYSSTYATMLGYPVDTIMDIDWIEGHVYFDEAARQLDTTWVEDIFSGKNPGSHILKSRHRQGHPLWHSCQYQNYNYLEDGNVDAILIGYSDITTQVQKQKDLEQARLEADSANASKSEFLARMSHEIRTPMNAIIGMSHLIRDTELSSTQIEQMGYIDEAAVHLLGIINSVLDFSKIEAGMMDLEIADFDLDVVLEQVTKMASSQIRDRDLELILNMENDVPLLLSGDSLRLSQILTNLLSNAIKFSEGGDVVLNIRLLRPDALEVTKSQEGLVIEFDIRDSGIGMSPDQVDLLFQPFVQADGSISRRYGGTGLGLAIVKHLVNLMGGTIKATSEIGRGSCFTFSVCLQQATKRTLRKFQGRLEDMNALVVDDNDAARAAIVNTARGLELNVTDVNNARSALKILKENQHDPNTRFQLVLLDFCMPDINGMIAAKMIKEDSNLEYVPSIIMVSAYDRQEVMGNVEDYSSAEGSSIDDYLNKPVTPSLLYNSIARVIGSPQNSSVKVNISKGESLSGMQVLLAEDNIVNQLVAEAILKKRGIAVVIVNNGQEAIDILSAGNVQFDAILMDLEMPVVDGYQATRLIREKLQLNIPIIAMTAHALTSDREKCLAAGMNDHINKPVDHDILYSVLGQYY